MSEWRVEDNNDVGPGDEGFWKWWEVLRDEGDYRGPYKCNTQAEAEWLASILNRAAP